MGESAPEALFAALVAAAPTQPFVTYYDEASGERSELSVRSCANWVAKTHFLLTDELGLGPGDAGYIDLPAHWISVPILLGCWSAGLETVSDPSVASVAFVTPASAPSAARVPDRFAIAPESAARGYAGTHAPPGTADYVAAVRPQADAWASVHAPATPADAALDGLTRADVVTKATARAAELGLAAGARILTAREWRGAGDWIDTLLAPLAVGGSMVYVRGATTEIVARRAEQERATSLP